MRRYLSIFVISLILIMSQITGCGRSGHSPTGPSDPTPASLHIKALVGSSGKTGVNGHDVLAKAAAIKLNHMVVKLTSSAQDTVIDTVRTPILDSVATSAQVINLSYTLKPLRTWKIVVYTKDSRDSIVHKDSTTTPKLNPADVVSANLTLTSKYTMYEVKFLTLPDSISSSAPSTGKDVLKINRLKFIIDSGTVSEKIIDSLVSPSFFASGATHTLSYDYVTPGSHTLKVYAYGPMNTYSGLLYYKSTSVNSSAGSDNTVNLTLDWVGPTTGTGSLSVTVGKVGKVTINSTLPGTVIN